MGRKKKSKSNKSSTKGFGYERELCKRFSLWWTEGERDDVFWRTSGSGARATNRTQAGKAMTKFQYGDMTFVDPVGKPLVEYFNFEFKRYHTMNMMSVLYEVAPEKSFLSFWAKCLREAEQSNRVPALVTRLDRGKDVLWVTRVVREPLEWRLGVNTWPRLVVDLISQVVLVRRKPKEMYDMYDHTVTGFQLDQFFEQVDPRELEKFIREECDIGRDSVLQEGDGS